MCACKIWAPGTAWITTVHQHTMSTGCQSASAAHKLSRCPVYVPSVLAGAILHALGATMHDHDITGVVHACGTAEHWLLMPCDVLAACLLDCAALRPVAHCTFGGCSAACQQRPSLTGGLRTFHCPGVDTQGGLFYSKRATLLKATMGQPA